MWQTGGKCSISAISKDTLEDAFPYLKERLDPEEDIFDSAARFRVMTRIPGEPVHDWSRPNCPRSG